MIAKAIIVFLLLVGCGFFLLGTIGILRMPNILTRLHPSTKCDTLGAGSVLLALAIYARNLDDAIRLLLIGFFLYISSATCGHAIGRSVFRTDPKYKRLLREKTDEPAD
ncbi:MAG: monovalent cation/H(+) antiporter subunit G [Chloroflexota bacterium]